MRINEFSTEALEKELEFRRKVQRLGRPELLDSPHLRLLMDYDDNFREFVETCEGIINNIADNGHMDDEDEYYVYETAMQALYGDKVFDWINDVID